MSSIGILPLRKLYVAAAACRDQRCAHAWPSTQAPPPMLELVYFLFIFPAHRLDYLTACVHCTCGGAGRW